MKIQRTVLFFGVLSLAFTSFTFADTFPEKPITILVASSAGGGSDITLRQMQPHMEKALGTKLIFQYEGGGGTAIGANMVAKSKPDGYTILSIGFPHYQFTFVLQRVDYTIDDLYPLGPVKIDPAVIRVRKDAPWNNLGDLITYAKTKPPRSLKASVGQRTSNNYLALKQIEQVAGVSFNIVPYSGGNPARLALINGEVDLTHAGMFSSLNIAEKSKVLAIHHHVNNWPNLTDKAKTVNEQLGVTLPDSSITDGLWVPARIRKEFPARYEFLVKVLNQTLTDPNYVAEMKKLGVYDQVLRQTPETYDGESRKMVEELKKYKDLLTN